MHGTTHEVICMSCGDVSPREPFQRLLASMNPGVARAVAEMPARRLTPQHIQAEDGVRQLSGDRTSPVRVRLRAPAQSAWPLSRSCTPVERQALLVTWASREIFWWHQTLTCA